VITATGITIVGCVRGRNEDSFGLDGMTSVGTMGAPVTVELSSEAPQTFVVADGLGGHSGGHVASRLVTRHVMETSFSDGLDHSRVIEMLEAANDVLHEEMERDAGLRGMGAAIAGLVAHRNNAIIFNVGDARVYQTSGEYTIMRSVDDRSRSGSSTLTQCLGGTTERTEIRPHLFDVELEATSRFLLCSDGLSDVVPFDVIHEWNSTPSLTRTLFGLLQAAIAGGAPDNVSILCVELALEPDREGQTTSEGVV
jgi:PPM family protein phosphatase